MGVTPDPGSEMAAYTTFLLTLLAVTAWAQDTHYCPDGWHVSDVGDTIECILLSNMDEGHGGEKNYLLKKLISDAEGQGRPGQPGQQWGDQWWIGATVNGPHSDHQYGNWTWDHTGTSLDWFDWMRNEPNDWRQQNCLTFLKDQDIFGFGVHHWNDWGCDQLARYICERAPLVR